MQFKLDVAPDTNEVTFEMAFHQSMHSDSATCVCFGDNANLVVSASWDRTVYVWRSDTGKCVHELSGNQDPIVTLASPMLGEVVLGATHGNDIHVWNLRSGAHMHRLRGHTGAITGLEVFENGKCAVSVSEDKTIRVWDVTNGKCTSVIEGNENEIVDVALVPNGKYCVTLSAKGLAILWDLRLGSSLAQSQLPNNTSTRLAISESGDRVIMAGRERLDLWSTGQAIKSHPTQPDTVRYTNAKVLIVGDSGVGKTGIALRLTEDRFELTESSDAHWATQLVIPDASTLEGFEREIWLWDFAGQANYQLIHQLFMDETALSVLVFNPQADEPFEGLEQWDRGISRAARRDFKKLLVAGRCDRGSLVVSENRIREFMETRGYSDFIETSAKTGAGCVELKQKIVEHIDWDAIAWTASPRIFKVLKDEILRLRDEGMVLLRVVELKQRLELRLTDRPHEERAFGLQELRAVIALLAGPGLVWKLEFGDFILLQPERINAYAAAVVRTVREHVEEIGVIEEERVLNGKLSFHDMVRLPADEEAVVLLAMHHALVNRGMCIREITEGGNLLVFPSYFKKERPELVAHPSILVSYKFRGHLDELYATLIVKLLHSRIVENQKLWKYAADFRTPGGSKLGFKMSKCESGVGEVTVYCDEEAHEDSIVTFTRYIHEHLTTRATEVERFRRYTCKKCGTEVLNHSVVKMRLSQGLTDIVCVGCESRVEIWDLVERLFTSKEIDAKVRTLDQVATAALDNESKELILVGHAFAIAGEAGQIFRPTANSDWGIDGEIEFKDDQGNASGERIYLQLKSGDSYLHERKTDEKEIFTVKNSRHIDYWMSQRYPVMLVVRTSDSKIRWMNVQAFLKKKKANGYTLARQIEFVGETFNAQSILAVRQRILSDR